MALVLDAAVHMRAARLAGITLDSLRGVDDMQLVAVLEHGDVLPRHHGHHRERCAVRLPALRAPAGMVMRHVALDADLDRPVLAFADQRSARKVARASFHAAVDRWMDMNVHGPILLLFDVLLVNDDRTD